MKTDYVELWKENRKNEDPLIRFWIDSYNKLKR